MDVSQYLEIFVEETKEHLQSLNDNLLVLEKEPENKDTINEIFRAAHSLKGMAGTMGYTRMQKLTHKMEDAFSEIRNDKMKVTSDLVDTLFQCLDALETYLDNIVNSQDEGTDDNAPIIKLLEDFLAGEGGQAPAAPAKEPAKEPAAKESQPAAAGNGSDASTDSFADVKYADFELHAMEEAHEKGLKVYGIAVHVDHGCILKAARAFLVLKAVEEFGELMKSIPSAQDIEDERFDFDFKLFVISEHPVDKIVAAVKNVSEIRGAYGEEINITPSEKKDEKAAGQKDAKSAAAAAGKPAQSKTTSKPVVNRSVRVDIDKLDVLMNLVSELIIAKNGLVAAKSAGQSASNSQTFNEQIEYLERVTTSLHESVMNVRMVPIETVVSRFPRMIRDLSKKLDKKMELYMTGEDTELDRTVIDEIGDPLMHLLRNSADHGLESSEVRQKLGKPEVGSIFLDAYQDGNNVVIEVRDDGSGIDVDKVRNKAIDRGMITPEQAETMTDKEIIQILFKPSFSTSDKITDVSGRGVGLDVVKSKIESLGGDVDCHSVRGEGSTFTIRLPLTLAIIQALMVKLGDEQYAISLGSVQTVEDIPVEDVKYVQGKQVITLRDTVIPLIRLGDLLDVPNQQPDGESLTVVIIKKGDRLAGLVVDCLIGQMEIVIKSLGKYININKMISGATILGDGEIALIIDANAIL
ncbi:MAG: chemotaxis protein CheW [Butyrivibrio sp.]